MLILIAICCEISLQFVIMYYGNCYCYNKFIFYKMNCFIKSKVSRGGVMKYGIGIIISVFCIVFFAMPQRNSSGIGLLENESFPGDSSRLQLVSVENSTEDLEFQIFPPLKESAGLSLPLGTLTVVDDQGKAVNFNKLYPIIITCSKGSYQPVFIQDKFAISGKAPEGFDGPFYVSMWLAYPHVAESSKLHVSYVVKKGEIGKVGVKIGPKGDYRLVAVSNVKFIH